MNEPVGTAELTALHPEEGTWVAHFTGQCSECQQMVVEGELCTWVLGKPGHYRHADACPNPMNPEPTSTTPTREDSTMPNQHTAAKAVADATVAERRSRELSITYTTDAAMLSITQLRDFVHRTRNQHGSPNWPADTTVQIDVGAASDSDPEATEVHGPWTVTLTLHAVEAVGASQ